MQFDTPRCSPQYYAERYVQHPKNFRKIASFLDFKSYGDCVTYYYQQKISLDLKKRVGSGLPCAWMP